MKERDDHKEQVQDKKKTYQSPTLTKQGTLEQKTQNSINGAGTGDTMNSS